MAFLEFTFSSIFHFVGVCILAFMAFAFVEALWCHLLNALSKRKDDE